MNLPNKLTLLRVCMIPFFVVFARMNAFWAQCVAVGIYALACVTDALDGHIARSRNLITDFGKFMDPIADKLLVMSALVVLTAQGRMPDWACILMLAREFLVSGFRLVAVENGRVIAAGPLGKLKTVFQMVHHRADAAGARGGRAAAGPGGRGIRQRADVYRRGADRGQRRGLSDTKQGLHQGHVTKKGYTA